MNPTTIARINKHADAGGRTLTVVPGNGFDSLTGKTSCTYLHDSAGYVSAVLLETAPGESVEEAADFLCQQAVLATDPTEAMVEMGITGVRGKKLAVVTAFDGVSTGTKEFIHDRLLRLSTKSLDMGHISEWPAAVVEAILR
jgi:hypothetical protein